jgi:hypothetical protein
MDWLAQGLGLERLVPVRDSERLALVRVLGSVRDLERSVLVRALESVRGLELVRVTAQESVKEQERRKLQRVQ